MCHFYIFENTNDLLHIQEAEYGVAAVRFLRGTLFTEVRIGIRDLRVKSAVRQTRQYALFAAIYISLPQAVKFYFSCLKR